MNNVNMTYDKINGSVGFRESDHYYGNLEDPTIKYTSVTTLIGKYEPEFNKEFVSKYKAIERLLPATEWKKVKGINGYIIFRRTGTGRYKQIAKLSSGKKSYIDKTVKRGRKYKYIIVSYKKIPGSNSVQISPASKVKKFKK